MVLRLGSSFLGRTQNCSFCYFLNLFHSWIHEFSWITEISEFSWISEIGEFSWIFEIHFPGFSWISLDSLDFLEFQLILGFDVFLNLSNCYI